MQKIGPYEFLYLIKQEQLFGQSGTWALLTGSSSLTDHVL